MKERKGKDGSKLKPLKCECVEWSFSFVLVLFLIKLFVMLQYFHVLAMFRIPFFSRPEHKIFKILIFFQLDGYEIRKGKTLKINISVANLRLFVGNIPKNKTKDEIKEEFGKRTGIILAEKSVFSCLFNSFKLHNGSNFMPSYEHKCGMLPFIFLVKVKKFHY